MITAIIPAAGNSSRMGDNDKLFLPFGQFNLLGTVINELVNSKVDELVVVLRSKSYTSYLPHNPKVKIVVTPEPEAGMVRSIKEGIQAVHQYSAFMICPGDMPQLTSNNYNLLINRYLKLNNKAIIQPHRNDISGNPVLFSHHFRDEILSLKNITGGCKPVVEANHAFLHRIAVNSNAYFTDIDTPEEYDDLLNSIS